MHMKNLGCCTYNFCLGALLCFLLAPTLASAQGWVWAKDASAASFGSGIACATDTWGNVYTAGYFNGTPATFGSTTLTNAGSDDVFILKYDNSGNLIWAKSFGGAQSERPASIAADPSGNILITGYYKSDSISFDSITLHRSGYGQAFIVKLDSSGHTLWAKSVGGSQADNGTGITSDASGNVLVTGYFSSPTIVFDSVTLTNLSTDTSFNMFVVKYTSSGNFLWVRQGIGNDVLANGIAVDGLGNCYVAGAFADVSLVFGTDTLTNSGGYDFYIAKYDLSGNLLWAKSEGGTNDDVAMAVATDAANNVYVTGDFKSASMTLGTTTLTCGGGANIFVTKYNSDGTISWADGFGGGGFDVGGSIVYNPSGRIYVGGSFGSGSITLGSTTLTNGGTRNVLLAAFDTSGAVLLAKSVSGTGADAFDCLASGSAHNIYATGGFSSPAVNFSFTSLTNPGILDAFTAKFNDTAIVPAVITGAANVCIAGTLTLADSVSGGTWSSYHTAIATINTSTGVLTGVAHGIDTIAYTLGGHMAWAVVVVDSFPAPAPIAGPSTVCMFSSITLTETDTAGWWSSGGVITSTDSVTGVVSGLTAGTDTVWFTDSNACGINSVFSIVTVNPSPVVGMITGVTRLCQYLTMTISDTTVSGIWHASNSHATVSGTGLVTGLTGGLDTISYSKSNSICTTTVTDIVTVTPHPVAGTITGPNSMCVGVTSTYADSIAGPGGSWGTITPVVVSTPGTFLAHGLTGGTAIVAYTSSNFCGSATASKTITIIPLSNPGVINGTDSVCPGSTITLTDTTHGGVWSITNGNATDSAGIVDGLTPGLDTLYYATTNVCGTDSAQKIITIVPFPYIAPITGAPGLCNSATMTLADSTPGGVWTVTNTTVTNTGGVLTSHRLGVDTVVYTLTSLCGTVSATKAITVSAYPHVSLITGTSEVVCPGWSITFHDSVAGGVWSNVDSITSFVADSVVWGDYPGNDTIYYTLANTCATATASIPITVLALPVAGLLTGPDSVCKLGTMTLVPTAPGGVWSVADSNASVSDSGVVSGLSQGYDTVLYTVTNMCGAATAPMPVYVKPLPTVDPILVQDTVCPATVILLADSTPSGVWSATGPGATIVVSSFEGMISGRDTLFYTYTNECGTAIATKIITILPLPTPATVSGRDSVCRGDSIQLTASIAGGNWYSTNPAIAYAGFTTGEIHGINVGTDTIFYLISNSCGSTRTGFEMNVQTTYSPFLTGGSIVCIGGARDTLIGSPLGGVWSTSDTNITFTYFSYGVVANGRSEGPDSVYYSFVNSCGTVTAGLLLQVESKFKPSLNGISNICLGKLDTIFANPSGGIWQSNNPWDTVVILPGVGSFIKCDTPGRDSIFYSIGNYCGYSYDTISIYVFTKHECDSIDAVPVVQTASGEFYVFPNPGTGLFNVVMPDETTTDLVVLDMTGRQIYHVQQSGNREIQLDLKDLAAGNYILSAAQNGWVYRRKLVIER